MLTTGIRPAGRHLRHIVHNIRATARPSATPPSRTFASASTLQADRVRIVEVGPRDGLQNEKTSIPVATKIELVNRLSRTGLQTIEAGSFVSPKWTPQMANSGQILQHILSTPTADDPSSSQNTTTPVSNEPKEPITYQWLLPNMKGLENMLSIYNAQPSSQTTTTSSSRHEISIFLAATETFSHKNTNCSIADSLTRLTPVLAHAKQTSPIPLTTRAYISVALGCPFEGPDTSPRAVADLATSLLEMGADEISVADTTGMGTATKTATLLRTLTAAGIRPQDIALHFHDTYGQALVNTVVALEHGVRVFDGAVAGLGGCPYSPGATGNVATEDLVHTLHSLGVGTGVDVVALAEVGEWISRELGRVNEGRAGKATLARLRSQ